jgi:hypothetical protein
MFQEKVVILSEQSESKDLRVFSSRIKPTWVPHISPRLLWRDVGSANPANPLTSYAQSAPTR